MMSVSMVSCMCVQGWIQTVAGKQAYFHAVAQHRMGLVAQAKKNFGEAVARLQVWDARYSECVGVGLSV